MGDKRDRVDIAVLQEKVSRLEAQVTALQAELAEHKAVAVTAAVGTLQEGEIPSHGLLPVKKPRKAKG